MLTWEIIWQNHKTFRKKTFQNKIFKLLWHSGITLLYPATLFSTVDIMSDIWIQPEQFQFDKYWNLARSRPYLSSFSSIISWKVSNNMKNHCISSLYIVHPWHSTHSSHEHISISSRVKLLSIQSASCPIFVGLPS